MNTEKQTEVRETERGVIDPVCGMEVYPDPRGVVTHLGQNYWFCSEDCRHAFQQNPDKYLHRA
jgi:YHS domain-containing protein